MNQARAERRRALVYGKVAFRAMPPHFWLWVLVGSAAFGVIYWRNAAGKLEARKSAVMAKQRAVAAALGPQIQPFRDQVEGWVRELAADGPGDFLVPGEQLKDLREAPGVYLRLRRESTKTAKDIRKAAQASLRDGFTSCLFVNTATQVKGAACNDSKDCQAGQSCNERSVCAPACRVTADCAPGQVCNEWNTCGAPPRPYNMRMAYRSLRVLSSEWTDELHEADTDLAVNAYDRDLDSVAKHDVPVAAEIMNKARFVTLVVDEDPSGGLPKLEKGSTETPEEELQRLPHFARIGIWDIATRTPLLRMRAEAAADFVHVSGKGPSSAEAGAAQARQANSCALALAVRAKLNSGEAP